MCLIGQHDTRELMAALGQISLSKTCTSTVIADCKDTLTKKQSLRSKNVRKSVRIVTYAKAEQE